MTAATFVAELDTTLGTALLAEHRSYLKAVRPLLDAGLVKGMAHVTGGGITENLPRVLPVGCAADVDVASWDLPAIFRLIRSRGRIATDEMFRAFNMGVGMVLVSSHEHAPRVRAMLEQQGENAIALGRVVDGDRVVRYLGWS